ncbi:ABC transporter substrate-binding protein [Thermococcus henrietii]|uniref:ABC transporter substrate-binding protein n=1 Tax=Thermococcus henrietii TaxID=2016361 RepID=UPI000C080093|nr:ABC transporter substrate-binding protein [Thermococcus henrietii]
MIAVFPASLAEIVKLVGKVGEIVGVNEEIRLDPCLPELKDKPVIGKYLKRSKKTYWDVLEELRPDLILDFEVENLHSGDELRAFGERMGARVELIDFETVEGLVEASRRIAELTRGDFSKLGGFYERHLTRLGEITEAIEERPKVLLTYRNFNVVTRTNVLSDAVRKAGAMNLGERIRTRRKVYPVKKERFFRAFGDAEHLFLLTSIMTDREKMEEIRDEILDSAEWRAIEAVQLGNVHIVGSALDLESFMRWSPRIIPGIYQLGRFVHGRAFPKWERVAKELYSLCGV